MSVEIKSPREIEGLRVACQMAAETLVLVGERIRAGMTTEEINTIVHEDTVRRDAYPAPLNYHGFPKSVCTSVNEVVCHGMPSKTDVLRDGDIVNLDVTTMMDGFHGDTSATFVIGPASPAAIRLVETARRCRDAGIAVVRDGARLGDVGAAIAEVAHTAGYSVVRDFGGHGSGRKMHAEPHVPHTGTRGTGMRLRAGMAFTIEPMITLGTWRHVLWDDGWTVVPKDRKWTAQSEHTLLVTESGAEILTLP